MAQKRGWNNCPSKSIPAGEIEQFLVDQIRCIGRDPALLQETIAQSCSQAQGQISMLESERHGLESELSRWHGEVRGLLQQIGSNDIDTPATDRLADLQERIHGVERRATEVREQMLALNHNIVNEREVAKAMAMFDPVWDSLTPREQTRIVQLLVERVDYDGAAGKVAITFHASGIKTLADEVADRKPEDAA